MFYGLIETAKLHGLDPEAYLTQVLERIARHQVNRIAELPPWYIIGVKPRLDQRQGYRFWPRTERANASDHPERLRLRRIEMSVRAVLRTFSAGLRSVVRFSGPWSLRFRARSSSKPTSSTQCGQFSIRQCARTAAAKATASSAADDR